MFVVKATDSKLFSSNALFFVLVIKILIEIPVYSLKKDTCFEKSQIMSLDSEARKWRHDSGKTQKNKPEWRTILSFLKAPRAEFLKQIF